MALHEIPDDGTTHIHVVQCPCGPTTSKRRRRADGFLQTVITHHERPAPNPVALSDRISVPAGEADYVASPADPDSGPEAVCGHVVIQVRGEWQHHAIPDDGAPHAATSKCECGPQRDTSERGHIVYEHTDQSHDDESEQLYREVFDS